MLPKADIAEAAAIAGGPACRIRALIRAAERALYDSRRLRASESIWVKRYTRVKIDSISRCSGVTSVLNTQV